MNSISRHIVFVAAALLGVPASHACSRATWLGKDGTAITGRSMDWPYEFNTHFYVIPRGEKNEGLPGGYTWESKHGTVVLAGALNPGGPINGAFDGMNEKGLGANMLYLAETDFGPAPSGDKPQVSWAAWLQHILSNYATVAEAVEGMKDNPIYFVPCSFGPGGAAHPSVHLSLTDPSGDSAIMEFLDGKVVIHHGKEYQVMTNSPIYEKQLTLNDYWSRMDNARVLPGSHQSEDRFVRASYYLKFMGDEIRDQRRQVAGVFSIMRNVSVPWGAADPDHPNIAPTYWRSVLDHSRKNYYFESALSPYVVMVDLNKIDFSPGSGVRSAALEGEEGFKLQGEINNAFKPTQPIGYLAPSAVARAADPTPEEARAIAKEAWLYAYAPLQGFQTMFNQAVNKDFRGYIGGFNRFRHYARLATPDDTDIVTPNNDTPYSWAWLDLRAEPMVLCLPEVPAPRYYVNQWFDMYTHNFAYTGVRATGRAAGNYLFAGPKWKGEVPAGITKVFQAETEFVGTLTRTQLDGPDDLATMQAVQAQFKLIPLSQFTRQPAPKAAPPVEWPAWDAKKAEGLGFITYLNAMLHFMPVVASEHAMRERFAKIGIGAGKPFDPDTLDPTYRSSLEQGVADASKQLKDMAIKQASSKELFGTRQELGADYIMERSLGAMLGIYGNTKEEAIYASQQTGPDGRLLDGSKRWVLRFEPGQLPPVTLFWSITMYSLPERLLADNPINRYSIGDRTAGLKHGADGSLEIYIQSDDPGPEKTSNWLPAPKGPFFFVARFYGPKQTLVDGTWNLPPLVEVK